MARASLALALALLAAAAQTAVTEQACAADSNWRDVDGDGCEVYASVIDYITNACDFFDEDSKKHCRKTCGTCEAAAAFMDGHNV